MWVNSNAHCASCVFTTGYVAKLAFLNGNPLRAARRRGAFTCITLFFAIGGNAVCNQKGPVLRRGWGVTEN